MMILARRRAGIFVKGLGRQRSEPAQATEECNSAQAPREQSRAMPIGRKLDRHSPFGGFAEIDKRSVSFFTTE